MDSSAALRALLVVMVVGMLAGSPDGCGAAHHRGMGEAGVVVEREDVCVVGSSQVEARYCARLALRDASRHPTRLSWLRIESADLLLQGDGVGPLGSRMLLGLDGSGEALKGAAETFDAADLSRMEQLLKEIIGGEAIGWRALGTDRDARVIQSPFKTMVVLPGGAGLGVEMEALVPKSFRGSIPDLNTSGAMAVSAMGLWHWLPASSSNWPSFFSSLGAAPSAVKPGRFLPQWLASRASVWSRELSSSSQWQVHQRSLTLVLPREKRQSLSLAYCESARSSSPPKCTADTLKSGGSLVDHNIPGPGDESELRVKLQSRDLSACSSPSAGDSDGEGGRWVLEGIERTLVGKGSHRVVQSTVTLSRPASALTHHGCQLRMLERLPNGVFADQFELQGIQRRGGIKQAWIHGDTDLEQPALLSTQSIVIVDAVLRKVNHTANAESLLLQATVAIPLHARYPPLSVDSHSIVHIPTPHMFVACQEEDVDPPSSSSSSRRWNEVVTGSSLGKSGGAVLEWMVPVGNPADYSVVARFTAISALTGVLVVLGASVSGERRG